MSDLSFLATIGPKCSAMEMYKRAKDRLFGAMYGKDPECAMEAYSIMHKLQKKAFGIFSPFQMEDFLAYPVVEFTREEWSKKFTSLESKEKFSYQQIRPFGRSIRDQRQTSPGNPCRNSLHPDLGVLETACDLVVPPVVRPMSKVDGPSSSPTGEG